MTFILCAGCGTNFDAGILDNNFEGAKCPFCIRMEARMSAPVPRDHKDADEEHVRFWPDGTKVVYQDAADASEHRLRVMEAGFETFEQDEDDGRDF